MKKKYCLFIIILFSMFCISFFTPNAKADSMVINLVGYDDYVIYNGDLLQESNGGNGYRYVFFQNTSLDSDIVLKNILPENFQSRYGMSQFYYNFNGTYLSLGWNYPIIIQNIYYINATVMEVPIETYMIYINVLGNESAIEFDTIIYYDNSGSWDIIDSFIIDTFSFSDNNINANNITDLEIEIHYRISCNNKVYTRCRIRVNQNIELTTDMELFNNPSGYTLSNMYQDKVHLSNDYWIYPISIYGYRTVYYNNPYCKDKFYEVPPFLEIWAIPDLISEKSEYWYYLSYQLENWYTEHIVFEQYVLFQGEWILQKFDFEFQMIHGIQINAKFYYTSVSIKPTDLGDWTILFNWLRDGLCWIVNALLLALQFLLYVLTAGISIIFGWLFISIIIPFIWNVPIFWLLYAGIGLLFLLWIGFIILIDTILYLFTIISDWFITIGLPAIINVIITVLSWIFALLLYVLTLGQGNLFQLQYIIQQFLNQIAVFFGNSIFFIVKYLPELLTYIVFYFLLIGFGYLKLTYVKARGFVNRSEQLESSINAYMIPVKIGYNLLSKVKELIIGWI